MPRKSKTSRNLDRILAKLEKKDKKLYENLLNKIEEVLFSSDIEHYKNLKYKLKKFKRVQIGSHVLTFKHYKEDDFVYFTDFDHHDNIYKK